MRPHCVWMGVYAFAPVLTPGLIAVSCPANATPRVALSPRRMDGTCAFVTASVAAALSCFSQTLGERVAFAPPCAAMGQESVAGVGMQHTDKTMAVSKTEGAGKMRIPLKRVGSSA